MRVLISGASGFIGHHLQRSLQNQGHHVYKLVRNPQTKDLSEIYWNPYKYEVDKKKLEEVNPEAVIHLSGESVVGLWTENKKKAIVDSRIIPTKFLCDSLKDLKCGLPKVFVSASGMSAYYDEDLQKQQYDNPPIFTENSPLGNKGFLTEVSKQWEEASKSNLPESVRLVHLRISAILGKDGGMLQKLYLPFLFGLGGVLGDGKQYLSWMSINDFQRAVQFILENENIQGPVNFATPNPVTNYDFTKMLGRALNRPTFCWVPKFLLNQSSWVVGDFTKETLLPTLKVYPEKLLNNGFRFQDPEMEPALKKLLA